MSPGVAELGPLLRASHRLKSRLSWEGFASKIAHMVICRIQFSDCWIEDFSSFVVEGYKSTSIPHYLGLSTSSHYMTADFIRVSQRRVRERVPARRESRSSQTQSWECHPITFLLYSIMNKSLGPVHILREGITE